MNDKYRALEEAMKETDKAMTEEQKERRQNLDKAYKDYCREESKDHFSELRFAFIMAAKSGVCGFSPFTVTRQAAYYETENGSWYILMTTPEEAALCPEEMILYFNMDTVVRMAILDDRYSGLCVNPYGGHPFFSAAGKPYAAEEFCEHGGWIIKMQKILRSKQTSI